MKLVMKCVVSLWVAGIATSIYASNEPHVGFAFPAGARQGTAVDMMIGGQHFKGATNVFVSGEGVTVQIKRYTVRPEARRVSQYYRNKANTEAMIKGKEGKEREKLQRRLDQLDVQIKQLDLPDGIDPFDQKKVQRYYKLDKKEQFNPQLQDRLRVRVTVAANAPPGERELRVYTPEGLSNPVYFQVSSQEEVIEVEPNGDHMAPGLQLVPVPSILNGQVRPGDMDHFRFKADKGDTLVVDVSARRIIPYLADAVPGWFQAVVALYDEDGNEVAYEDDYKFNPDPVLFFDVPKTGTYTLSIRDSIYRGREDFIYRIAIGELPFITSIFPLGAQQGKDVDIALSGRNLPKSRLQGKLPEDGYDVRHISVKKDGFRSNQMPFAIGEMNETFEVEPNNTPDKAQPIKQPLVVNGRIQQEHDRDVFCFEGKKGDSISIEVVARRLNSPLDSVITLTGPGLDKPIRNDDYVNKDKTHLYLGAGLVTHHADSYLLSELPASGTYFVEIGDTQSKGGHDYGYRLRISPSNPDFKLRMEPSGLHIGPNGTAAFTIRATRLDGFDKKITLEAGQLPEGFTMSEATIPKGAEMTRFTITAPSEITGGLVSPEIFGTGMIKGQPIKHRAVPVDDQMQAFLYRHLVPARELVLAPVSQKPPLAFEARLPKSGIIELPAGADTRIQFDGRAYSAGRGVALKLNNPPEGFSIKKNGWIARKKLKNKGKDGKAVFDKNLAYGSIIITVDESVEPGTRLSLIVEAEIRKGKENVYYPAPAIPIKVVKAVQKDEPSVKQQPKVQNKTKPKPKPKPKPEPKAEAQKDEPSS